MRANGRRRSKEMAQVKKIGFYPIFFFLYS